MGPAPYGRATRVIPQRWRPGQVLPVPEVSTASLRIMLRIADTRTGRLVEIPSAHRHLLRICVHLPVIDTGIGAVHLRAPLVGDVLARTAELHGLQSVTVLATPDLPPGRPRRSNGPWPFSASTRPPPSAFTI